MKAHYFVWALTRVQTRNLGRIPALTRSLFCSPSPSPVAEGSLKNVTKSNFEAALAALRRHVREADFVSIDLEMTGVRSAPWRGEFMLDSSDIQYLKVKDSAEKFAVVQFGVCPFRWDSDGNCFVAHPHNFYIFPRPEVPVDGLWNDFLCQTSSLEFLAKYKFDFNTCIYEGISYLSRSQELEAFKQLDLVYKTEFHDASNLRGSVDMQPVRMADILFAERMRIIISEWCVGLRMGRRDSQGLESVNGISQKFETTFFHMRPSLVLNGLTSRQLKAVKLVTEKHFKDLCYVHAAGDTTIPQSLIVHTDSAADRDLLMMEVKAHQRKKAEVTIEGAIGFRHVIDLLSSEGKLIVGHNCFLDLAHVYSKFLGPLPATVEEFVSALHMHFPRIIDTKVLLNSDDALLRIMQKAGTSLSKAFVLLCSPIAPSGTSTGFADKPRVKVDVQVDDQRFSNWNSRSKHEAGYNAFMTGCIFAQACLHLGIDHQSHTDTADLVVNAKLQKYINHVYLSWKNGSIIDLKTGKHATGSLLSTSFESRHPKVESPNIIILWGLPSKLRATDIRDCLGKFFGWGSITYVYRLDETAAFVQFKTADFVAKFFKMKGILERRNDPLSVLHPLSKLFEGGNVQAGDYGIYEEACSSPLSEVLFSDQVKALGLNTETGPNQDAIDLTASGSF